MMKRVIAFVLLAMFLVSLTACGDNGMLNGTYVSESGDTELIFSKDGTCSMTESGIYIDGVYTKTDSGWQMNLKMLGFITVTYNITKSGKNLVVSDDSGSEVYTKK